MSEPPRLRIALGEYDTAWHDPVTSLDRATALVERAAASGAQLVALPEMCTTGFTMDAAHYAENLRGPSIARLQSLARSARVHLVAGVSTREGEGDSAIYFNSSLLFSPEGVIVAEYRKQRLFAFAEEHSIYTPGDRPMIATIGGLHIALLICFDLRFPELFRAVAPYVDAILVVANWPSQRQSHWDTLLRARAIESQAWVVGVNRLGEAGGLNYGGGSAMYDPWGELVAQGSGAVAAIEGDAVTQARRRFPLVEDRRGER